MMKKSSDVGLQEEEMLDGETKIKENVVDLRNQKNSNAGGADKVNGNSSSITEENFNPVMEDDNSDVIILREDKTISKDENCSSEAKLRSSVRLKGKRPKLIEITTSDEGENHESDDDFNDDRASKSKSVKKRSKALRKRASLPTATKSGGMSEAKRPSKCSPNESKSKKSTDPASKIPKEYTSGAFVVLKTDFHASRTPAIWRIDGKALLQKYIHFDQDGQILYKNTSTYSGWVANNKDQYYPATVEIKSQSRKETVVKFLREAIIVDDSD